MGRELSTQAQTLSSDKAVSVARVISLRLEEQGRWSSGHIVEEKEILPGDRASLSDFVLQVFPGQVVEHMGRSDMASLLGRYGRIKPSSLFFQAVHRAYAEHHALGLRPEVLMYLVNSVVAETVRRNADHYRGLFTRSDGKEEIEVRHDGLRKGDPESPWHEAIGLFDTELRMRVPSKVMASMLPGFSSATVESDVASLLAFMDAASPFYDYRVHTLCGIPRIVLLGDKSDYVKLYTACVELSHCFADHLKLYFDNLLPVLSQIKATADGGRVDEDFWGQIYKHYDGSGGSSFRGWISAFLWYLNECEGGKKSSLVVKDDNLHDWSKIGNYHGISSGSEPSHVSSVPFTWNYFGEETPMRFVGGVLAVEVEEGALTPQLSYGVLHSK